LRGFALGLELQKGAPVVLGHDLDEGGERVVPVFEEMRIGNMNDLRRRWPRRWAPSR